MSREILSSSRWPPVMRRLATARVLWLYSVVLSLSAGLTAAHPAAFTLPDAATTQRAIQSSPIATIDQWRSPVLVVQADDDRDVPSQQSSELIEALRSHRIPHDELILPNEIHDLARYASWIQFFQATDRYFDEHLAKRATDTPQ